MKNIVMLLLFFITTFIIFGKTEIIVIKNQYKLYLYIDDKVEKIYEIGLSQNPIGDKKLKGDNKMPEGEYYIEAEKKKIEPPKNTALGGGIGIHGWLEEDWDNSENRNLTWGCIVMHNKDIEELYDKIPLKTKLIIKL